MALAETTAPMLDARRRILDAALRCFAASGFHGASMQEICSAAKMSPGGLYRHFASKDEIIAAIAEHVRLRNASYFACLLAEGAGLETFLDTGFAYLREVTEGSEAALCAEVFAEAQRNPRIRSLFEANHEQARATLTAALEKARERGDIDPGIVSPPPSPSCSPSAMG